MLYRYLCKMNLNKVADTVALLSNSNKIKVGAVSYLNTKPLIYGLENGMMKDEVELVMDYPRKIAQALLDDTIDIGLVPVAIIPEMKEYFIDSGYCIACNGEVASVCLFSDVPVEKITRVLLDYESRTSVLLVQYLLKKYWKIDPLFEMAGDNFINQIRGSTAAVVIGDKALKHRKMSPFIYDLGLAWKQYTGLPFVFAAWVSNKPMSSKFIADFNEANQYGLQHLAEVVQQNPFPDYDLNKYYKENIQYHLDEGKRQGLQLFLDWCRDLQTSSPEV